jgi:hypothetical protein
MIITIKGKECELGFTFNSFKYMENFDVKAMDDIENKPFMVIGVLETLLMGAVNTSPKVKYSMNDVSAFIEEYIEEESITELLSDLMELLQESSFFKSLQKTTKKKK